MKNNVYIPTCLLSLLFLCFSCCQNNNNTNADTDSTAIKLGLMPTIDCLPFYYADSTGIFDSLDINVKLITFESAIDADTSFVKGHIDAIASDLVKVCLWEETDSIHTIMSGNLNLWLVTSRNARILKAESLREKIIGITRHSAVDFFTDKVLESVDMNSIDLNKPQINNLRLRTLMTDQNQYDGSVLPEPYASEAVARGAKRLKSSDDLHLSGMLCVAVSDSLYKHKGNETSKLKMAYDKAVEELNADTLLNICSFLPSKFTMHIPDSLFSHEPLHQSSSNNDSLKLVIKKWLEERKLIKVH